MTEYDFSEEGYRRHLEAQSRVSHWAHQTSRHAPANPFVPSEVDPRLRSDFYTDTSDSASESDHSVSSSSVTARSPPKRSHTMPHRDTSHRHDDDDRHYQHRFVDSKKSRHTHSRSSATTTDTMTTTTTTTETARPTRPSRSHTTDLTTRASDDVTSSRAKPIRSKSTPLNYEHDLPRGATHIRVPPSKRGYTYIVIPRNGAPIKVVSPSSRSRIEYFTKSPSPSKPQPPLLKRIFGSIVGSSNSDAKSAKTGRSRMTVGVETGGKPRRRRGSF